MKLNGATIFLLMQVFFVILGLALFFGLKSLKESKGQGVTVITNARQEKTAPPGKTESPKIESSPKMESFMCDFQQWVGQKAGDDPVQHALKRMGRPFRVLPPGSMATMDYNEQRINLHTDANGVIVDIRCG